MKKTLLFLMYSCLFVGSFAVSANEEVASRGLSEVSTTFNFPVFMYVVNRVCSPAVREYFKGDKNAPSSPVSIIDGVNEEVFVDSHTKKQVAVGIADMKLNLKTYPSVLNALNEYLDSKEVALGFQVNSNIGTVPFRRQVSFSDDTKTTDGSFDGSQRKVCLTPDLRPTPEPMSDYLKIDVAEINKGRNSLRRIGSDLVDCYIKSPSPPPSKSSTPADSFFCDVRTRVNSEESLGGFYLGSVPSNPSTPREKMYRKCQLDNQESLVSNGLKTDDSFYGSHAELKYYLQQINTEERLTEGRTDLQRKLIAELAASQKIGKQCCPISPVNSPDTKK